MLEQAFFGWIFMSWNFIRSFFIKLMKVQKHFTKQSLPEDGLNTRNRAGNDSKQQAYTHATVFNQNNFYSINHRDLFRPL